MQSWIINFQRINKGIEQKAIDKELISKIVDSKIIQLVDDFLKDAAVKFECIYPDSIFYALCLHVSAMLKGKENLRSCPMNKL